MTQDYFSVFNLAPVFDIDLKALEEQYFTAQRRFHPDRLVGKSPAERQRAISHSMVLNTAYEILKSPLKRAQHLLFLRGITVGGEQDSIKPSHSLLMEIMERREALAEADSIEKVIVQEKENSQTKEKVIQDLSDLFIQEKWQDAAQQTIRLGYLVKTDDEIRIKKKGLASLG